VLVVAHTGLDRLVTVKDIWRELPMDKQITMKFWSVPPHEVPQRRVRLVAVDRRCPAGRIQQVRPFDRVCALMGGHVSDSFKTRMDGQPDTAGDNALRRPCEHIHYEHVPHHVP
jgi:hypothetical protein